MPRDTGLVSYVPTRYHVFFAIRAVVQILQAVFLRAEGFIRTVRPTLRIQIHLTNEEVGTLFTAEVIHEHNPILCVAASQGQELFFVARCVTTYTDSDSNGDESGTLEGTFVSNDEAATKALAIFRQDTGGKEVEGRKEFIQEDGTLKCEARSVGQGAWRWNFEVLRGLTWAEV
ncbi:MAG: hypothetical protein Q9194_002502 [Teloschistes cf. exilis]